MLKICFNRFYVYAACLLITSCRIRPTVFLFLVLSGCWCTSDDPHLTDIKPCWTKTEDLNRPVSDIIILIFSNCLSFILFFFLKIELVLSLDPWMSTAVDNHHALKPTSLSDSFFSSFFTFASTLFKVHRVQCAVRLWCRTLCSNLMLNKCFGILYK